MKLEPWVVVKSFTLIELLLHIKVNEFPFAVGCDELRLKIKEFIRCGDDSHIILHI
jgi:hypothetical protein